MAWLLIDKLDMDFVSAGVPEAQRKAFRARWESRPICPTCYFNPQLAQREQTLAKVALGSSYYYHCAKCFGRLDPL
ncbi:MAG TPA: hypothetical protein VGN52_20985 [Burkholderiales bacterium]